MIRQYRYMGCDNVSIDHMPSCAYCTVMGVYVLRHADKEKGEFYQPGLRFNNQPITEEGKRKAEKLVPFFDPIRVDAIYVSEYLRTQQTISYVATQKKLTPIVDNRLNEIDVGVTEQMTDGQIQSTFPDFWHAYFTRTCEFRIPGGETGEEAAKRIMGLFSSLDRDKNYILVTHEGLIRTLVCTVLSMPPYRRHLFKIDPCSITQFEYLPEFTCWSIPKINREVW